MAEIIDLNINIGANTTDFEGSLTKAQNLLKQFEAALKKATNVGEINYLNNSIKTLNAQITTLGNQMNRVGRPAGDATTALSNLSRVAQDAPYGFIGIANNLNPLLESFQRLQKESGSSTNALKAMAAGLTGPAGIGLALGVVSSLAVTFSDEISAFFKGPTDKLKTFREELNKLNQDIYKIVGEAQSNRTIGLNLVNVIAGGDTKSQQEALKRLKSLYSENKAIKDATIETDKAYLIHLINVAAIQEDAAGKEKNTQQVLSAAYAERAKLLAEQKNQIGNLKPIVIESAGIGTFGGQVISVESQKAAIEKRNKPLLDSLNSIIVTAKSKNLELVTTLTDIETPDPNNSPVVNYAREENKALTLELAKMKALREKMKSIGLEPLKLFELPSEERAKEDKRKNYFEKQAKELLEQSDKGGFGKYMQGIFKKDKSAIDSDEAEKKRIDDLKKSYINFADTISGSVTNSLMGMYDAMQSGQKPLEAIGDMFANIGKQIAAAVIQALIFQALLEAFPALKGAFAAAGALSNAFGAARNLAPTNLGQSKPTTFNTGNMTNSVNSNGQFVLRGQDLVLAMQRSNSSLNIIRG